MANLTIDKRDNGIDFVRGIGMLLIICGHYMSSRLGWCVFSFHIPLFFMISGFLCRKRTMGEYLKRNVKKVLLPYIIGAVILLGIDVMLSRGGKRLAAILLVYANSAMDKSKLEIELGVGPIWFFPCYFLVGAICLLLINYSLNDRMLITSVCVLSFIGGIISRYIALPFCIDNGLVMCIFFITGYCLSKNGLLEKIINSKLAIMFCCLVFLICQVIVQIIGTQSYASRKYPFFPLNIVISEISTITFFILAYSFFRVAHKKWITKPIINIGRNSILILCIHSLEYNYIIDNWVEVPIVGYRYIDNLLKAISSCILYIVLIVLLEKTKDAFCNME